MRLALLLLVTGCQVVFPLEDDSQIVELRTTFTRTPGFTNHIIFEGEPEIQPGDLLIAMIQAQHLDDIAMTQMSPGWALVVDEEAKSCTDLFFHVWFLRTIMTTETVYDFAFDLQDEMSAIVTAYSGATSAQLLKFELLGQVVGAEETTFPAAEIAPGSIAWFGGGAQRPWGDPNAPVGTDQLDVVDNLSTYQLHVPDGQVPAVVLPIPEGFCADVAQIKVEP